MFSSSVRLALTLLSAAAVVACGGGTPDDGADAQAVEPLTAPVVRDSAGVRIVENTARLRAPAVFRLGPEPLLEVGGIEGNPDIEFNHLNGYLRGVPLSGGGLAVIDMVRVHYFNAQGARIRITGRKGSGPEEFLYLTAICRTRGDTLLVGDDHNRRLGVLDSSGAIVRTITQADLGGPPFDFCFDDGTFLLLRDLGGSAESPGSIRLTRVRLDGSVANAIGDFPGRTLDFVTQSGVVVVAAGERLYYGDGTSSEVKVYDRAGTLLSIIRTADPSLPITEKEAERRLARTIPKNVSASERAARLQRLRALPHAITWPTYGRVHVTPRGTLWIEDYQGSNSARAGWTAFDSTGRMLGRLRLAVAAKGRRSFEVISLGDAAVLMRSRDADRAAYLTLYPILDSSGQQ
jgi:hypothetical protein